MEKTFREIAEMHYQQETNNEPDEKYKQMRINALEKLLTKQLNILYVSKRSELLSKFYTHLCEIAVVDSEYRTEYDKKMIPSKFTL